MDPVAFWIGNIPVRWYGLLIGLAILLGTYLAYKEAERQNIDPDYILNIILIAIPCALIGARIYYVIFRWSEYYKDNPLEVFAIWHGGLAFHGGLIFGVLAGYLVIRKYKLSFWKIADIVAPSIILGQAIGRWGNFFNQEAYGYPTDLPWAMYIAGAYRHPTFLYESLWNFSVFIFLLFLRRKDSVKEGEVFLSYGILYSIGRLIVESFRTDSLMLGPFRVAQLVSLTIIVVFFIIIYFRRKREFFER